LDRLEIKIADFGFSCFYNPEFGLDTYLGSQLYMAPEICNHEKYDKSVDIWAIGIITYMLLSGRNPFPGNNEEIIE